MNCNANVGKIDKPKGLVKSKSSEEVSRGFITKRGITKATTKDVKQAGGGYPNQGCLLHYFVFWRG